MRAAPGSRGLEQGELRTVLGHFASGVAVVTGLHDGQPAGFTCQSFFSLSLEPPLVAIAPGKVSTSWPRISGGRAFCVNVLTDAQEAVCRTFADPGADKFAGLGWSPGATGAPRLDGALAWVDCAVEQVSEAGDHYLVVGRVVDLGTGQGEPLLFYRGGFGTFKA